MNAPLNAVDPAQYCDESLKLRHMVQKLHWIGLHREADQIAREIEAVEHGGPAVIVPLIPDTD